MRERRKNKRTQGFNIGQLTRRCPESVQLFKDRLMNDLNREKCQKKKYTFDEIGNME